MDESSLRRYAELVIRVGLNLQPGQRLLTIGPLANGGALDAAPVVRALPRRRRTPAPRSPRCSGVTSRW